MITSRAGTLAPHGTVTADTEFFEAGLTSLDLLQLHRLLTSDGLPLPLTDVFRFPTARRLAEHVAAADAVPKPPAASTPAVRPPRIGGAGQLAVRRAARARLGRQQKAEER
jgi:Phosphopantetheine attachment site